MEAYEYVDINHTDDPCLSKEEILSQQIIQYWLEGVALARPVQELLMHFWIVYRFLITSTHLSPTYLVTSHAPPAQGNLFKGEALHLVQCHSTLKLSIEKQKINKESV